MHDRTMSAIPLALRDQVITSQIFCYAAFLDISAFQRVCKPWWAAIARRVRLITLGVLSRWFENPAAVLEAMIRHGTAIPATVALRVACRLGFYQQSLPKKYFYHEEVGEVPRVTIVLPDSDIAELVRESGLGDAKMLNCARYWLQALKAVIEDARYAYHSYLFPSWYADVTLCGRWTKPGVRFRWVAPCTTWAAYYSRVLRYCACPRDEDSELYLCLKPGCSYERLEVEILRSMSLSSLPFAEFSLYPHLVLFITGRCLSWVRDHSENPPLYNIYLLELPPMSNL